MRVAISPGAAHNIGRIVKLPRVLPDITVLHFELNLVHLQLTRMPIAVCPLINLKKRHVLIFFHNNISH